MSLDAMKQALEAAEYADFYIESAHKFGYSNRSVAKYVLSEAITDLRAAIEQAQEPVALETVYDTIIQWYENDGKCSRRELARRIVALYTAPRQWQGLTADEIWDVWCEQAKREFVTAFARSLEAKLKDKNL